MPFISYGRWNLFFSAREAINAPTGMSTNRSASKSASEDGWCHGRERSFLSAFKLINPTRLLLPIDIDPRTIVFGSIYSLLALSGEIRNSTEFESLL